MIYIESESFDPHFNLALEQYVFDNLDKNENYFMLWQNDNAIIVGKHQNTVAEINAEYTKENNIKVVRRLSGGGAVYHDLGNLNFTFIVSAGGGYEQFNFSDFCKPIIELLNSLGVNAVLNGRNDMSIEGKKFSGNSQYAKRGRIMHHGTIMFDSDLDIVGNSLVVSKDKIQTKGVTSIRSRVTNIKPHMQTDVSIEEFKRLLVHHVFKGAEVPQYHLTEEDIKKIEALASEKYRTWDWNYGSSPKYSVIKERRFEGVGGITLCMDVENGIIKDFDIYGDYFGNGDKSNLKEILVGKQLRKDVIEDSLKDICIGDYINKLEKDEFIDLLI